MYQSVSGRICTRVPCATFRIGVRLTVCSSAEAVISPRRCDSSWLPVARRPELPLDELVVPLDVALLVVVVVPEVAARTAAETPAKMKAVP